MSEQPRPTPQQWIDTALAWLASHPHSSALQVAQAIGCADKDLIYGLLKAAERAGKTQRYSEGHIWLWEVLP